jgi:TrmH family RNA methyltransferase
MPLHEITSSGNALFRTWQDCLVSKGIKKHGQFLVFGERAVRDTLERAPRLVRNLILPKGNEASFTALIERARDLTNENPTRFSEVILSTELFSELDVFGTQSAILVLTTPEIAEADLAIPPKGIEIVCGLQDASNLGALLRTAAAFSASQVVLLKECASPFHPKAVRAASGHTLSVRLSRGPSMKDIASFTSTNETLHRNLQSAWVALDMHGEQLPKFTWPKDVRLLLGEEGQGVPESKAFRYVSVPMAPEVESLNAGVALGITMYSYRVSHPF